jgi:hypothetical protein
MTVRLAGAIALPDGSWVRGPATTPAFTVES